MKIKFCRNCKNNKFFDLLSLGKVSFTGKFPKSFFHNIPSTHLNLLMCKKCKLVQLDRNFNPKYLYGKDYGYRTGINHNGSRGVLRKRVRFRKTNKFDVSSKSQPK